MESGRKELMSTVCNLYMTALLAVIPLYTGGTYYQIGDTKYMIFRDVSIICLGLWIFSSAVFGLRGTLHDIREAVQNRHENRTAFSCGRNAMDICMSVYGVCVALSALFSPYGTTPWLGYRDWHMGALSQLMFVGIYFFVSRCYGKSALPIYLGEAALAAVTFLGLANRLGWDILGMFRDFEENDWGYSHMLSTIGNINWLCGYYSVAIAFPAAGYLSGKRPVKTGILYTISAFGLALLIIQGSDSGVIIAAACVALCFLFGYFEPYRQRREEFWRKGLLLLAAVSILVPAAGWLSKITGAEQAIPGEGFAGRLGSGGWWLVAVTALALYGLMRILPGKAGSILITLLVALGIGALGCGALWYLAGQPFNISWGSDRGGLWRAACKGFESAGPLQKLLGAGPDCYAEYIYRLMPAEEVSQIRGHWEGAVFANAHNEWLNQLVNLGLLGTAAYMGIFVCALKRYRAMPLGIIALTLYGINSMVSFQQVLNAPLLFLTLGLCENKVRQSPLRRLTEKTVSYTI